MNTVLNEIAFAPPPFPPAGEPRCPACGYILAHLTRPVCPECGGTFDPYNTLLLFRDRRVRFLPRFVQNEIRREMLIWLKAGPPLTLAAWVAVVLLIGSFPMFAGPAHTFMFIVGIPIGLVCGIEIGGRFFTRLLAATWYHRPLDKLPGGWRRYRRMLAPWVIIALMSVLPIRPLGMLLINLPFLEVVRHSSMAVKGAENVRVGTLAVRQIIPMNQGVRIILSADVLSQSVGFEYVGDPSAKHFSWQYRRLVWHWYYFGGQRD